MSWSNNLAAYLGGAPIKYACLFTLDGSNCFGEAGDSKEKISAGEISKAVKTVATDEKIQGLTIAGNKYVYILDDSDVFVYKKLSKACLFFHKKTCKYSFSNQFQLQLIFIYRCLLYHCWVRASSSS